MADIVIPRLKEDSCGLLVIDLQEKFVGIIQNWEEVVQKSTRLIRFFQLIQSPIIVTEQYPQGLGSTISKIREILTSNSATFSKTTFSSCGSECVKEAIQGPGRHQWVLCGIETHVCVQQSALDLLQMGHQVFIAVDAVSSRNAIDRETGLRRLEKAGAVLSTSEALIFEALRDAKHPRFREAISLVR